MLLSLQGGGCPGGQQQGGYPSQQGGGGYGGGQGGYHDEPNLVEITSFHGPKMGYWNKSVVAPAGGAVPGTGDDALTEAQKIFGKGGSFAAASLKGKLGAACHMDYVLLVDLSSRTVVFLLDFISVFISALVLEQLARYRVVSFHSGSRGACSSDVC